MLKNENPAWLHNHGGKIIIGLVIANVIMALTLVKSTNQLNYVKSDAYWPSNDSVMDLRPDDYFGIRKDMGVDESINKNTNPYDINADGQVDYKDAEYISRYVAGLEESCPESCDVSGNGTITSQDAALVAQYLSGPQ